MELDVACSFCGAWTDEQVCDDCKKYIDENLGRPNFWWDESEEVDYLEH